MRLRLASTLIALCLSTSVFATEYLKGQIKKTSDGYSIVTPKETLPIIADEVIMKSIPSLESPSYVTQSNGRKYSFEFKGERISDGFMLDQVPTNIAGDVAITGKLNYNTSTKQFSINGVKAKFGYTKELNGYQFDEISKQFYIGKEVLAEGYYNKDNTFVMNALTPANLFTAAEADPAPVYVQRELDEKGAWDFTYKVMNKNEYSQSQQSYRTTFYQKSDTPVVPGDSFLVITMSGRQGDTFGSVNGHFVAGLGMVRDDLTLRGEVSNAYVTNGKDILAGNTSLTNYFSHIVQGQNNYRPTYTLIAYGVDKTKLKQFRDALEESLIEFRTQKLEITPQFNCTTETVKALRNAGIVGNYIRRDNIALNILTYPLQLFGEMGRTLNFTFGNDASLYHPRPAYNAFAGVFLRADLRAKLGIKRVDFVFYAQTPSERPVGGAATWKKTHVLKFKKLYDKYEVSKEGKLSPAELRPLLEEKLQVIE